MKKLITLPLLMLVFIACNKKDSGPTRTDLLTSGSWKLVASEADMDANGSYETDFFSAAPACEKDDFVTFQRNGQMIADEGPTKCDVMDPQTETFSWQFSNNDATLTVDGDALDVLELNTNTLKVKLSLGGSANMRSTFTKR